MFLIKLKTIGNCIIPDLDNFILYTGNDEIIDLEEWFPIEKIKKSMKYPDGNLKQLIDQNIIKTVHPDSSEYKKQIRDGKKKELENQNKKNKANKKTINEIIEILRDQDEDKCEELLLNEFFDNLSVLDRVINDDGFSSSIKALAKELMDEDLNQKIDDKFVLI
jgi:hypothetical protein